MKDTSQDIETVGDTATISEEEAMRFGNMVVEGICLFFVCICIGIGFFIIYKIRS